MPSLLDPDAPDYNALTAGLLGTPSPPDGTLGPAAALAQLHSLLSDPAALQRALDPASGTEYGAVLPLARDTATGALRLALPSSMRSLAQGAYDLARGPATGTVTPEASMTLLAMAAPNLLQRPEDGLLSSGPIRAYHGSPHDFDAFDASKIGSGEGAQAYGHGLYFAETEGVARSYRDALSGTMDGQPVDWNDPAHIAAEWARTLGSRAAAATYLENQVQQPPASVVRGPLDTQRLADAAAIARSDAPLPDFASAGRMYEVGINADPEDFLHWDKPLSQQSQTVLDALKLNRPIPAQSTGLSSDMTYSDTLKHFVGPDTGVADIARSPDAAQRLSDAGIPGIRYLDQGSRRAGQGTHNYVVFDARTIDILRKYGLAGLMAGGGAAAAARPSEPQP